MITVLCMIEQRIADALDETVLQRAFGAWLNKFERHYVDDTEHEARYSIWKDRAVMIIEHNAMAGTYQMGFNNFSDWTNVEYQNVLGFRRSVGATVESSKGVDKDIPLFMSLDDIPDAVDWRAKGYSNDAIVVHACSARVACLSDFNALCSRCRALALPPPQLVAPRLRPHE